MKHSWRWLSCPVTIVEQSYCGILSLSITSCDLTNKALLESLLKSRLSDGYTYNLSKPAISSALSALYLVRNLPAYSCIQQPNKGGSLSSIQQLHFTWGTELPTELTIRKNSLYPRNWSLVESRSVERLVVWILIIYKHTEPLWWSENKTMVDLE